MKKLMIFVLMVSLFTFGGNDEVKNVQAITSREDLINLINYLSSNYYYAIDPFIDPECREPESAATFFDTSDFQNSLANMLNEYKDDIVSLKVSNDVVDLPLVDDMVDFIKVEGCTFTDASGNETMPAEGAAEGVVFAFVFNSKKGYGLDCVLYANVETIYLNKSAAAMFYGFTNIEEINLSMLDSSKTTNVAGIFINLSTIIKVDISNFDLCNCIDFDLMFYNCSNLEYLKSPKALAAKIELPSQFSDYYGINALTADNLAKYPTLCIPGDTFINNWKNLRTDGGANGICAALVEGSYQNNKLKQLINEYDSFDDDYKKYVNSAIDKEEVTVGESIQYVKNVLNGSQGTDGNYGLSDENKGSFMTMSIREESPYLIAIISLIGVLSVLGYYFYNKKKQTM